MVIIRYINQKDKKYLTLRHTTTDHGSLDSAGSSKTSTSPNTVYVVKAKNTLITIRTTNYSMHKLTKYHSTRYFKFLTYDGGIVALILKQL